MKKFALLLTVSAAFLARIAAAGTTIGVNFISDTNTDTASGVVSASAYPDALQVGDLAGASPYTQTNWNNLGTRGSGTFGLTDSAGNPVTMICDWDSGHSDSTGTAGGLGTPDGKLMDGFLYSWNPGSAPRDPTGNSSLNSNIGDKPLFYVGGLNAWYTAQGAEGYGVVMYITGYSFFEVGEYWVESVSGNPTLNTMVSGADLTPHYFVRDTTPFTGTYIQTTSTDINNPPSGANYAVFTGMTNDAVLLRVYSSGYSAGLNGFQFFPIFPTLPTATAPTFAPSATVFAGVPVTISEAATGDPFHPALFYQWMNDTNGNPATNFIHNATNSTFSFTPTNAAAPYTMNFAVIVTNMFGGTTSAVASLTVNPAVPPFVTQDTTPGAGNGAAGVFAYVGSSITFSAAFGGTPSTFLWQSNSVNIPGATSLTLTIANLQLADSANYQLTATNSVGGTNSTPAALTVLADPPAPTAAVPYAFDAFTNTPVAYWRFGETLDNVNNSVQAYDSSGHGFDATYGNGAMDNQPGPQPSTYPGFESTNTAVSLLNNVPNSFLISPPLNLHTNTVTITAWINPASGEVPFSSILTWANGSDKAGFGFGGNNNGAGMAELGYTWDTNNPATFNFHSALYPPANQWSFVALTITPTSSTIYLYYIDGNTGITNLLKSVQTINNLVEPFSGGTTWIGSDTSAGRNFNGLLDEVAVYNKSLGESQIQDLFLKGIGAASVAPTLFNVTASPVTTVYSGQNVIITATNISATDPVSLQWQSSLDGSTWTNVPGANAATYVANPLVVGNRFYQLAANNAGGSGVSSSVEATFTPLPSTPPGLWTVNFQVTNNILNFNTSSAGLGSYAGRGILGTGMNWNVMPDLAGAFNTFSSITSVSDLTDSGTVHSGIYCTLVNGFGFSSGTSFFPTADVNNLLGQFVSINFAPNALQFHGVPDGTYNLAVYACDGSFGDRGTTLVVHDAQNGNQTNSTVNASPIVPLSQGVNFVLFSNVHVSGGTLMVDVGPNSPLPTHPTNTEADINAAQLQLVGYDVNPAPVFLTGTPSGLNLSLNWSQGLLETSTNVLGPWTQIIAPAPTAVPMTNGTHYFRVQVH